MKLDPRVVAIAKQFEPGLPLANWTDDNRRAWVMQVIEQVVFRFPDGGWGAKRALSMTQRYMHLSPAALDSAIQLLDSRGNSLATATSAERKARS